MTEPQPPTGAAETFTFPEAKCRRDGHSTAHPDYCDRCGRPFDGGWRRSL